MICRGSIWVVGAGYAAIVALAYLGFGIVGPDITASGIDMEFEILWRRSNRDIDVVQRLLEIRQPADLGPRVGISSPLTSLSSVTETV
jgi:hypothetical protein